MKKLIIMMALSAFSGVSIKAQDATTTSFSSQKTASTTVEVQPEEPKPTTLPEQFQRMIDKAGSWQNYKMFDKAKLASFQRSMADSVNNIKSRLAAEKGKVKIHEETIKTLNDNIASLQTTLDQTRNEKDSMNLFGALLSKGLYNTIMWGIIIALGVLLVLYIYKYSNGNIVTRKSLHQLSELQEEYESYRKAAIEREQKVRRQLQDEINKHR